MHFILSSIAIFITLLLTVGIHETGHALAALLLNIKIKRISIGFGKPIFVWRSGDVEWVWGMWPLGGYVHLLNSRLENVSDNDKPFCFDAKPMWQRILVLLAGVFANLMFAYVALVAMLALNHQQTKPIIHAVIPSSIADKATLKSGDEIIQIAGRAVSSWQTVVSQFILNVGQEHLLLTVKDRQGSIRKTTLDLSHWRPIKQKLLFTALGIQPNLSLYNVTGVPLSQAFKKAGAECLYLIHFFIVLLKLIVTHAIPFTYLLGPLGIMQLVLVSFFQGLAIFLLFIANFSIAVAVINLIPFPGLDGGNIVLAIIEKIRGKPISVALETLLYRLMFIAFCILLVQLFVNDLQKFV